MQSLYIDKPYGAFQHLYLPRKIAKVEQRIGSSRKRGRALVPCAEQSAGDVNERRAQEILRRAADLRKEQEALAEELADLAGESVDDLEQLLQSSGLAHVLNNENGPNSIYDPGAGEIPQGLLRSELERMLGLRPAFDAEDPLAFGLDPEEVEAFARSIEDGHGSYEPPPGFFSQEPEPAEEFLSRLEESVKRFEELLLSKKEQTRLRREKKAAGFDVDAEEREFQQLKEELEDLPMFPEEFTENIPAPQVPPEAAAQFHRAQRVLLVLRRVFVDADTAPVSPCAPVDALLFRDLVDANVEFEDPWLAIEGIDKVKEYLALMERAGASLEFDTAFSDYYEYRPEVRCRVILHTLMRLPLPNWYLSYLILHDQPDPPPADPSGPRRQPGQIIEVDLEDEFISPGSIYPRNPGQGGSADDGSAYLKWMRWPHPIAARPQVLLGEDSVINGSSKVACVLNTIRMPDYSLLPSSTSILSLDGWASPEEREDEKGSRPPPLPREGTPDLEMYPMTPDEAEQLLRTLLGDVKFEKLKGQLPEKADIDRPAEEDLLDLKIGSTWAFDVDPHTGRVASVELHWGWVGGLLAGDITRAYDMYISQVGLLENEYLVDGVYEEEEEA